MEPNEEAEYLELLKKEIGYQQLFDREKNPIISMGVHLALEEIYKKKDYKSLLHMANFQFKELIEKLEKAENKFDFIKLFKYLEIKYNFGLASPLLPNFVILPPYIVLDRMSYVREYKQLTGDWIRFHEAGILPFDQEITNEILGMNVNYQAGKIPFIDIDYFIMSHKNNRNLFLGRPLLALHEDELPGLLYKKDLILNIGSIRANKALNPKVWNINDMLEPLEYEVSSKEALLDVIKNICAKNSKYEVWFRGQPNEYLLKDMVKEAIQGKVPYRNIRDISLPPSLYRNTPSDILNIKSFAKKNIDLSYYSFLMSQYLNMDKSDIIPDINEPVLGNNSLQHFENPLRYSVVKNEEDGSSTETLKQFNPVSQSLTKSLFLQHYGFPSSILDITSDIDVALFFAQMHIEKDTYIATAAKTSYIYVFLIDPTKDMMLNSAHLLKKTKLLRPVRQKCGLLYGASMINRNHYSRYISIKIKLMEKIPMNYNTHYLFPGQDEDDFLKFLAMAANNNKDLTIFPFEPKAN